MAAVESGGRGERRGRVKNERDEGRWQAGERRGLGEKALEKG